MGIRYDSFLARTLAREILDRWRGVRIAGLRMASGRRAVELAFEDGSRLVAMLHPLHGYILELGPDAPASGVEGKAVRTGRLSLLDARAPADERALLLTLGDRGGRPWEMLAIELQDRRWNAVHCRRTEDRGAEAGVGAPGAAAPDAGETGVDSDPEWRIEAALLARDAGNRSLRRGARYVPPSSERRAVAAPPSEAEWAAVLAKAAVPAINEADSRQAVLRTWAWTSALNVDWILAASDPAGTYARYRALHALAAAPPRGPAASDAPGPPPRPAFVLDRPWGPQPYPHPAGAGSGPAAGLLTAAAQLLAPGGGPAPALRALPAAASDDDDGDETAQLRKRLRARRKRHRRRAAALERQLAAAGPPDEPRLLGQILLARKDEVPKGAADVTLPDFGGAPREIALDPARTVVANAEAFFDEARRRERALARLPDAIASARERAAEFDAHLERLADSGPSDALWAAAGGKPLRRGAGGPRPGGARAGGPELRTPYTRLRSSGGLEIRVGRGARDNDDLTFRHAAPDDIWLHASQASGAHVILRWGRKDENPPKRDLLEAAVAAAVHSGARHNRTAPVVWTRRKYVRKPRKSPPGTVAPNRVQTIFVEPDSDLVKAMARRMEEA
ncbi:NFACT RNA binding domain-containing protein [Candidatus Palauibacter sp.]|uniref:NFACT RNA binding domain-containing protein n=1 Tax=Candidatus Palauibacter sp. TaxID=3101350 RepID=UPI003B528142